MPIDKTPKSYPWSYTKILQILKYTNGLSEQITKTTQKSTSIPTLRPQDKEKTQIHLYQTERFHLIRLLNPLCLPNSLPNKLTIYHDQTNLDIWHQIAGIYQAIKAAYNPKFPFQISPKNPQFSTFPIQPSTETEKFLQSIIPDSYSSTPSYLLIQILLVILQSSPLRKFQTPPPMTLAKRKFTGINDSLY